MLRKAAIFLFLLVTVSPLTLADQNVAPLLRATEPIPNNYLITLVDVPGRTRAQVAQQVAAAHGGGVVQTYDRAFRGAHIELGNEASLEALRRNPNVIAVEEDGIVRLAASTSSWGLDRIDQRYRPLDGQYNTCSGGQGYSV